MYEFLDRLISIALPRIRDFRGVNPKSFDGHGNYSLGLSEQMVFPEIDPDKVTFTQGMDVTFVTSTNSDDEARELLRAFRHAVSGSLSWIVRFLTLRPIMSTECEGSSISPATGHAGSQQADPAKAKLRPRDKIRIRLRCRICGRARAVFRKFGVCRICFRDMASDGLIPGVKKASW